MRLSWIFSVLLILCEPPFAHGQSHEINQAGGEPTDLTHDALGEEKRKAVLLNNQGALELNKGNYVEALRALDESIRLDPENYIAFLNRAITRHRRGDGLGTIADYQQLIRLRPQQSVIYIQNIISEYDNLIKLHPADAVLYLNRGKIKSENADEAGALADFNKGLQLDPTNLDLKKHRELTEQKLINK